MFVLFYLVFSIVGIVIGENDIIKSRAKLCPLKSPDFKKCAVKEGNEALASILQGDPLYGIPRLQPLRIPFVEFSDFGGFNLNTTNVVVYGIQDAVLKDLDFKSLGRKMNLVVTCPNLTLDFDYNFKGKIGRHPFYKNGHGQIEIYNGTYIYAFDFELEVLLGKLRAAITRDSLKFDADRIVFNLAHLGDHINDFLNENWRMVFDEFGQSFTEGCKGILRMIVGNIMKKISLEDHL